MPFDFDDQSVMLAAKTGFEQGHRCAGPENQHLDGAFLLKHLCAQILSGRLAVIQVDEAAPDGDPKGMNGAQETSHEQTDP